MQADFENISVACLLGPVASESDAGSLARKSRFYEQLRTQLDKVRKKRRQYILCGNWNMAHAARDVQQAWQRTATVPAFSKRSGSTSTAFTANWATWTRSAS